MLIAMAATCLRLITAFRRLGIDAYGNPLEGVSQPEERRRLLR